MDDIVLFALEQVAFYGSRGVTLDELWQTALEYYSVRGVAQTIDDTFKGYLWSLLKQCDDFVVGYRAQEGGNVFLFRELPKPVADLAALEAQFASALRIRASEQRQWMSLTGHAIDTKRIPPLMFACLSSISASRSSGLSLIDLYKDTGQDKRSAPARCKRLAELGLIHGFPILARGAITTLYVHQHFLMDNIRLRETQDDCGGRNRVLDLHKIRRGISDLLRNSTNQILKVRDCCVLMKMDSEQADSWTQTRFYGQLRLLASRGFVKLIRVPGKFTGTLIRCVQLLQEYQDDDDFEEDNALRASASDAEDDAALDPILAKSEKLEEIDLSFKVEEQDTVQDALVAKDALLEWTIWQIIDAAGDDGLSGPQICAQAVGSHWPRPIDEQLKRVCPDPAFATQPKQYASLALGPAVQETMGKVRQFRYYNLAKSRVLSGSTDSSEATHRSDGLLPELFRELDLLVAMPRQAPQNSGNLALQTPKRGRPRKNIVAHHDSFSPMSQNLTLSDPGLEESPTTVSVQKRKRGRPTKATHQRAAGQGKRIPSPLVSSYEPAPTDPSAVMTKKRGRPTKAVMAERLATIYGDAAVGTKPESSSRLSRNTSITEPDIVVDYIPGVQRNATTEAVDPIMTPESAPSRSTQPSRGAGAYSTDPDLEEDSSDLRSQYEIDSESRAKRVKLGPRDLLRAASSNSTAKTRERLLLQILDRHGGIMSFDTDLVHEYEAKLRAETGIVQSTDKNTIRRTLDASNKVTKFTRSFEAYGGRAVTRHIYCLNTIGDDTPAFQKFIADAKEKEKCRRTPQAAHKPIEIGVRPEMDVFPSISQTRINKFVVDQLNRLSDGGDSPPVRIRLSEKASTHGPRTKDAWYAGGVRLLSFHEACLASKESTERAKESRAQARALLSNSARSARPKVKKPSQKSNAEKLAPSGGKQSQRASVMQDADSSDTSSDFDAQKNQPVVKEGGKIRASSKKSISKRGDRFVESDEDYESEVTLEQLPRRRLGGFTDFEDDSLIRAASLSMLFFSKSDLQPKIDWDLVDFILGRRNCRKRYSSIRNRMKSREIQAFIHSDTFAQLYNAAVSNGVLSAVPRDSMSAEGDFFELRPLIAFSRRFNSQTRAGLLESLPASLADIGTDFAIQAVDNVTTVDWREVAFTGSSSTIKLQSLMANAFFVTDRATTAQKNHSGHLRSAIKSLLLTKEAEYDAAQGKAFLLQYGQEDEINTMIAAMVDENLVVSAKGDAARLVPGRNYQLSEKFFSRFRATVNKQALKIANDFHHLLEESFLRGKAAQYSSLSNDGAAAATMELALREYVVLDQGKKKWATHGLIHDYSVRHIDESLLDFDVSLRKTGKSLAVASQDSSVQHNNLVPCFWIDIHGKVMLGAYHGALSLLVALLITRGRMSSAEMVESCSPVFVQHEVDVCLRNLQQLGCIEERDELYNVLDHYYAAFAQTHPGHEDERLMYSECG